MRMTVAVLMGALAFSAAAEIPWNLPELFKAPKMYDAPQYATNNVKACFFESVPYKGKPTRVFAFYGFPTNRTGKVPAIVLVHGGGGSAFYKWVELWNSRGYAAISMDTCGAVSNHTGGGKHPRHEWGGPGGWGGFDQINDPIGDQWSYHAVAAVIKAHSLLLSFPEVDTAKTGITGISWGGYLTCIAGSLDDRFKFAVPVYGCGFLGENGNSTWRARIIKMGADGQKWFSLWDPSSYLPLAKSPFLWVTGSNDFAYPMDALQKSYHALKVPYTLCVRLRMPHGHGGAGENPEEIRTFADSFFRDGVPLVTVSKPKRTGNIAEVKVMDCLPFTAELNYTTDTGVWQKREWKSLPAEVNVAAGTVKAELPADTAVYYFNIKQSDKLVVSSEHEEIRK